VNVNKNLKIVCCVRTNFAWCSFPIKKMNPSVGIFIGNRFCKVVLQAKLELGPEQGECKGGVEMDVVSVVPGKV